MLRAASFLRRFVIGFAGAALALAAAQGIAAADARSAVQSLEAVRLAAERFVHARAPASSGVLHVTVAPLDARLRLASCARPLQLSVATGAGLRARTPVAVACDAPVAWRVFVTAAIETELEVLVARRTLARGEGLAPVDLEPQQRRVPGLAEAYPTDRTALAGRRLKRAVPAGAVLVAEALAAPKLVQRGQQVTLLAATGGIEVRATGIALGDAGAADRVRVQNTSSQKVVEGVAENPAVVRVLP